MREGHRFAALASASALGACTLVVSTDDLSRPSTASIDARDGEAPTAPLDAGTGSSPTTTDSWCPANAIFCDDFERGEAVGNGWSGSERSPRLSTDQAKSPSKSLAIRLGQDREWNFLKRDIPTLPKELVVAFALYAKNAATVTYEIVKVAYGPANNWEQFAMFLHPEGLRATTSIYFDSPTPTQDEQKVVIPAGALYGSGWHRIQVFLDIRTSPRVYEIYVDDKLATTIHLDSPRSPPTSAFVVTGVSYSGDTPYEAAFIDDFSAAPK